MKNKKELMLQRLKKWEIEQCIIEKYSKLPDFIHVGRKMSNPYIERNGSNLYTLKYSNTKTLFVCDKDLLQLLLKMEEKIKQYIPQ